VTQLRWSPKVCGVNRIIKMTIPSLASGWRDGRMTTPRIYVLEIRKPDKTEAVPVAWLLVERQETYRLDERDQSVSEATIELTFQLPRPKHRRETPTRAAFSASYHAIGCDGPSISLTSHSRGRGAVYVDPASLRGYRVGTYLMNEIVLWTQQWPHATVNSIELLEGQAYEQNKARRNRFYEQFGLIFDYRDRDRREGLSRPMLAGELTPVDTWKTNLRKLKADEFLGDLLFERDDLASELKHRKSLIDQLDDERRRAENRPFWWAIRQLWARHGSAVAIVGTMIGFGVLAWWR
jgi:GNAT superfamily N-acetyltransferase